MPTPINILFGSYPGCWPDTPQEFLNNLPVQGYLNESFPGIIKQDPIPDPIYQDRLWFRPMEGFWFFFLNGQWVRPIFPLPGSGQKGLLWFGTLTDLWSEDGGDGHDPRPNLPDGTPNPAYVQPTDSSGSVWIPKDGLQGRVIVAPGAVPGAFVPNTTPPQPVTIAAGATADSLGKSGEYAHTQAITEMPVHQHWVFKNVQSAGGLSSSNYAMASRSDGNYAIDGQALEADVALTSRTGGDPNNAFQTVPSNVMQPYYGAYTIVRTSRRWAIAV